MDQLDVAPVVAILIVSFRGVGDGFYKLVRGVASIELNLVNNTFFTVGMSNSFGNFNRQTNEKHNY